MKYVYVIQDVGNKESCYIGYTADLRKRIRQHNQGESKYTSKAKWRLIYYEAYLDEKDARNRERKLKQDGRSRHLLMGRIINSRKTL